jgi:hypothetical protein
MIEAIFWIVYTGVTAVVTWWLVFRPGHAAFMAEDRRMRHDRVLRDIADLQRELGLNTDDPAYRSVWRQQPRIRPPRSTTWDWGGPVYRNRP